MAPRDWLPGIEIEPTRAAAADQAGRAEPSEDAGWERDRKYRATRRDGSEAATADPRWMDQMPAGRDRVKGGRALCAGAPILRGGTPPAACFVSTGVSATAEPDPGTRCKNIVVYCVFELIFLDTVRIG